MSERVGRDSLGDAARGPAAELPASRGEDLLDQLVAADRVDRGQQPGESVVVGREQLLRIGGDVVEVARPADAVADGLAADEAAPPRARGVAGARRSGWHRADRRADRASSARRGGGAAAGRAAGSMGRSSAASTAASGRRSERARLRGGLGSIGAKASTGAAARASGCYARGRWTSTSRPSTRSCATRSATSCSTEVAPVVDEHERERRFPVEIVRRHRRARLARHPDPRGRGRGRPRHARLRHRDRGDRPGLGLARAHRRGPHEPRLRAAPPGRARTDQQQRFLVPMAQGKVIGAYGLTEPGAGSDSGGTRTTARHEDGPDGGSWVIDGGKRFITNAGQAGTYIVTARTGTRDDGVGRDQRLHRPGRHARVLGRPARGQARAPRVGDRRAAVRGRPGARREPARRAGRAASRCSCGSSTAGGSASARSPSASPRRALDAVDPVRPDARAVRPADRHVPGRRVHGRRHGDRDRGGARARLARGVAQGPGPRLRARGGAGQAVRVRGQLARHQQRHPDPRRLRLRRPSTRSSATCATPS